MFLDNGFIRRLFAINGRQLILVLALAVFCSCGLLKKREQPDINVRQFVDKPLSPEKNEELLQEVGSNWLYGNGLGSTAITVGTVFVFPPYALYVVGNGILSLSGYEPIQITDALPAEGQENLNAMYDTVSAAPGKLTAALAGKEFRSPEVAKQRLYRVLGEETQE